LLIKETKDYRITEIPPKENKEEEEEAFI